MLRCKNVCSSSLFLEEISENCVNVELQDMIEKKREKSLSCLWPSIRKIVKEPTARY